MLKKHAEAPKEAKTEATTEAKADTAEAKVEGKSCEKQRKHLKLKRLLLLLKRAKS